MKDIGLLFPRTPVLNVPAAAGHGNQGRVQEALLECSSTGLLLPTR